MKRNSKAAERISRVEDREARNPVRATLARVEYLNEYEASQFLGNIPVATLRAWRCRGGGPMFVRAGARIVRYRVSDLEEFMERGTKATTSTPDAVTVEREK